jgi:hypothetical protein
MRSSPRSCFFFSSSPFPLFESASSPVRYYIARVTPSFLQSEIDFEGGRVFYDVTFTSGDDGRFLIGYVNQFETCAEESLHYKLRIYHSIRAQ